MTNTNNWRFAFLHFRIQLWSVIAGISCAVMDVVGFFIPDVMGLSQGKIKRLQINSHKKNFSSMKFFFKTIYTFGIPIKIIPSLI